MLLDGEHAPSKTGERTALVDTNVFFETIKNICNINLSTFVNDWIKTPDVARFFVTSKYDQDNKKLEVTITQTGRLLIDRDVNIGIQDVDNYNMHHMTLRGKKTTMTFAVTAKVKQQKRKKVRLETRDEENVDLTEAPPRNPVLWFNVDPDEQHIAHIDVECRSCWESVVWG